MTPTRLADIVKAYDIRGLVPGQLDARTAAALGSAFAQVVVIPEGEAGVVIGQDMRDSSPELARAFAAGVTGHGVDVTLIGLCSTDVLYYASGQEKRAGAMITASHNPAGYNGIKLAMAAQNFGGAVKYLDESDREAGYDLPLMFRIGLSAAVLGGSDAFLTSSPMHRLIVSAEAINTNDFSERLHLGGEYWFSDFLALRAGYRMNYAEGNWSLGFGLSPSFAGMEVRLDYAYVAYEFLDAPHRFTLTVGM